MTLTLITPPASDVVSLSDLKAHSNISHDDDDALLLGMIQAATARLDGRDGALGIALLTQVWRLTIDRFESDIALPLPPCQAINSITYLDKAGATQTLASTEYQVIGLGSMDGARIRLADGKAWPYTRNQSEAIAITFTAGFGNSAAHVPEPIRASIKMRASNQYENRESIVIGDSVSELPDSADAYIRNYRQWVF